MVPSTLHFAIVPISPDFIPSLRRPKQHILWIGCSDGGFEETRTLDLLPDEMTVLRNMGNIMLDNNLTSSSMMQYAVDILQMR
jgi:carbonic anhydrase